MKINHEFIQRLPNIKQQAMHQHVEQEKLKEKKKKNRQEEIRKEITKAKKVEKTKKTDAENIVSKISPIQHKKSKFDSVL